MKRAYYFNCLAFLFFGSLAAHAGAEIEHYQAQTLVSEGNILPLNVTLSRTRHQCFDKLIDARLYQKETSWRYHLQIRTQQGETIELNVDASNATLLNKQVVPKGCAPIS